MKKFLKDNLLIWAYLGIAILIELFGVLVTSGKFYIRSPWLFFLLQAIIVAILFCITNNKARHIVSSLFLIVFFVVNLVFIVIFEMTSGTIFDYGMLNLRNDGMAILESVPINFLFFSVCMLMIAIFVVFGARYARHNKEKVTFKFSKIIMPIIMVFVLSGNCVLLYFNNRNFQEDVQAKLYRSSENSYCEMGITANFINELVKGKFFSKVKLGDEDELENYIYDANSIVNSNFSSNSEQEYNLVTMLVESFEWTSFMQDFDLFVNGNNIDYAKYTNEKTGQPYNNANEILEELYPNIYSFYKNSIALTNFYSREKTDISENLCIMGSYPTNAYINYDFPNNEMATSMPSVLKTLDEDIACQAFHNGSYTYYNRNKELISAGFDSYTASDQMYDKGMTNWAGKGERNLDYEMIKYCADEMFPTSKRFYTHITTITMHGQYTYRKNLDQLGYYDDMAKFGIKTMSGNSTKAFDHNNFYYYCACVMEFDRALGEVNRQLEERGLKDNTIVLIFGDHNTYYSSLSEYVKGIDSTKNANYTNLYRVPCMIQYPNMSGLIEYLNTKSNVDECSSLEEADSTNKRYVVIDDGQNLSVRVKKFACTADIMPTLMDLLGINYWGNLYFGHSVFDDTVSVLYSRAYDVFITDNMYFVSLNNIKYIRKDQPTTNNDVALKYADISNYDSEDELNRVEQEGKLLLKKLDSCNRIFYNDYFGRTNKNTDKKNVTIFKEKLIGIN